MVIDGGWSAQHTDQWGRAVPFVPDWPSSAGGKGFGPLADWTHGLGLKIGVWHIRGALNSTVAAKLPIKGAAGVTVDQIVWDPARCPTDQEKWCRCTWCKQYVGINSAHPAAQPYYDSLVELYAEWKIDLLKWDCLYEWGAGYSAEEELVLSAVRRSQQPFVLSLSPGGGMRTEDCNRVAEGRRATMYRVTGDFHASPAWPGAQTQFGLAEHVFVVGNISRYFGANNTWPDLDMMDLGKDSIWDGTPTARLHAAIWMLSKSPLMFAGRLPASDVTLNLIANSLALDIHSTSMDMKVGYQGDCACRPTPSQSQYACQPINAPGAPPCVAVWWSSMPNPSCRAIGVFNIGNSSAPALDIKFADVGLKATAWNVTNVYDSKSVWTTGSGFTLSIPAQGGELLLISPGKAQACARPMGL